MKSPELKELIEAAHKLIEANRVRPRQEIPGMALLWVKLAAYEASELHKPVHLHPVAGRSIDDAMCQIAEALLERAHERTERGLDNLYDWSAPGGYVRAGDYEVQFRQSDGEHYIVRVGISHPADVVAQALTVKKSPHDEVVGVRRVR